MSYLVPIKAALIIFPFLALLITLPYIIYEKETLLEESKGLKKIIIIY